jgi:hypothetical protein
VIILYIQHWTSSLTPLPLLSPFLFLPAFLALPLTPHSCLVAPSFIFISLLNPWTCRPAAKAFLPQLLRCFASWRERYTAGVSSPFFQPQPSYVALYRRPTGTDCLPAAPARAPSFYSTSFRPSLPIDSLPVLAQPLRSGPSRKTHEPSREARPTATISPAVALAARLNRRLAVDQSNLSTLRSGLAPAMRRSRGLNTFFVR